MGTEQRFVSDCRDMPSVSGCSLVISGREDEVVRAAMEHAVSVHGETKSAKLEEEIRASLKPETPLGVAAPKVEEPELRPH